MAINKKIILMITGIDMKVRNTKDRSIPKARENAKSKKGMVLPFLPLSLAFENVKYYTDMPNVYSNTLVSLFNHIILLLSSNTIFCNEFYTICFHFCIFLAILNI